MATWNPATASCDHPEDTADMLIPVVGGGSERSFTGGGGGRGGGASCRGGRRMGSRARAVEASDAGGDEDRSWKRDGDSGTSLDRRTADGGGGGAASVGNGGSGGRGRGRSKKEDVVWVQCDNCLRWRKLAPGMLLEDLPDKW